MDVIYEEASIDEHLMKYQYVKFAKSKLDSNPNEDFGDVKSAIMLLFTWPCTPRRARRTSSASLN